jgi:hypothetical protein
MFSLAKERMESTRLWQIVRKMPKGALLHAHMDAMVDFDYLFNVLLETKGMHIFSTGHFGTEKAREGGPFQFRFQKVHRGMWMKMSQSVANFGQWTRSLFGVLSTSRKHLFSLHKLPMRSQTVVGLVSLLG